MNTCFPYYDAHSARNLDSSYIYQVDSSFKGQEVTYDFFHQGLELHHNGPKSEKLGSAENMPEGVAVSGSTAVNFISPIVEYQIISSLPLVPDEGHMVPTLTGNEGAGGSQSFSFIERDAEEEVNGLSVCLQQTLPQEFTQIKESINTKESTNGQFETGSSDLINSEQLGTNVLTHPNNIVNLPSLDDIELSLFNNQSGKREDEGGDRNTDVERIQPTINTTDLISDNGQVSVVLPLLSKPTETPEAGCCHNGKKLESPRGKKRRRNREEPLMWEIKYPFQDKEREKKRTDAIRAKKNRDRNKKEIEELKRKLADAIEIRNTLRAEVSLLKQREKSLAPPSLPTPNVHSKRLSGNTTIM